MSEEEKEAINKLEKKIIAEKYTKNIGTAVYISDLKIVLNLIQKQQKEIDSIKHCSIANTT